MSDLSPDGQLFLYAARKAETPERRASDYTHKWTAISKPPYFTALALWPTGGKRDVRPAPPAHEPLTTDYPL